MSVYIDTSALAKWYVQESFSDEFDQYIQASGNPVISRLAMVELRCLLARRRRAGALSEQHEAEALRTFEEDIRLGYLAIVSMQDRDFAQASDLIEKLKTLPLRTLDALHLATAINAGHERFATADRVQAQAAQALGLQTDHFYPPETTS